MTVCAYILRMEDGLSCLYYEWMTCCTDRDMFFLIFMITVKPVLFGHCEERRNLYSPRYIFSLFDL